MGQQAVQKGFFMRVLIVKTSSMGDVIHTLPAVTDAARFRPELRFDWLVEEAFLEIPSWHPIIQRVIPVAWRRWRKNPWRMWRSGQWRAFRQQLREQNYDLVLDAQGLIKSAFLTRLVPGIRAGMDHHSAREPIAARAYDRAIGVSRNMHAVERLRQLFASALQYPCPQTVGDYGLNHTKFNCLQTQEPRVVFIHGTTRANKLWPESYWQYLCQRLGNDGFQVRLPWGSEAERERAQRISEFHRNAVLLPRLSLSGVAAELAAARAAVAVDTGLGHLAAALDVPTVSLYGTTSPRKVGAYGYNQVHLCADQFIRSHREALADVFRQLAPEHVYDSLIDLVNGRCNGVQARRA